MCALSLILDACFFCVQHWVVMMAKMQETMKFFFLYHNALLTMCLWVCITFFFFLILFISIITIIVLFINQLKASYEMWLSILLFMLNVHERWRANNGLLVILYILDCIKLYVQHKWFASQANAFSLCKNISCGCSSWKSASVGDESYRTRDGTHLLP